MGGGAAESSSDVVLGKSNDVNLFICIYIRFNIKTLKWCPETATVWYDLRICVFSSVGKCDKSSWMNAESRPLICGPIVTPQMWVHTGAAEPDEPQVQVVETGSLFPLLGQNKRFQLWVSNGPAYCTMAACCCCTVARLTPLSTFPQVSLHEPVLFWLAVECNQRGFWACVSCDHVTWWTLGCQHKHIKPWYRFQNAVAS